MCMYVCIVVDATIVRAVLSVLAVVCGWPDGRTDEQKATE